MSDVFNGLFGGSNTQEQQKSTNQAYPYLQGALSPQVSNGTNASGQLANMLGLNGPAGQQTGFDNWRNSTGYQFGMQQGQDSITGNAATQGLLNSGSTLKALDTYGQNYANTQYQNYLNPLQNLMAGGTAAAGVLGSAGNTSEQTSNTFDGGKSGASNFIGALLGK